MSISIDQQALWIVSIIGAGSLFGAFYKMKGGFGPMNLRGIGIVLVAVLASLLAVAKSDNLTAAMGILGAIVGYLFGAATKDKEDDTLPTGVDAAGAHIHGSAKVAGRDINETINNIEKMLGEFKSLSETNIKNLQLLDQKSLIQERQTSFRWESKDPKFVAQLKSVERARDDGWTQKWIDMCISQEDFKRTVREFVRNHAIDGWEPKQINFDNHGDGVHVNVNFEREFFVN